MFILSNNRKTIGILAGSNQANSRHPVNTVKASHTIYVDMIYVVGSNGQVQMPSEPADQSGIMIYK